MSTEKPTVKVKYSGKKRRSGVKGETVEESEVSGDEVEQLDAPKGKKEVTASSNSSRQGPQKRVNPLDLPGPEPRSEQVGSKGKPKNASPKTPLKTPKPTSTIGSKVSLTPKDGAPPTPASDISNSETPSRTERTTEAERRAYLESHPDVAELEPHRVRCRCCDKWLKLNQTQKYALVPWRLHKKSCTSEKPSARRSRLSLDHEGAPVANGEDDDDASSVAPSISASEATGISTLGQRRSVTERQRILEDDELSGEVRPDAVFCPSCAKWVKLSGRSPFQLRNWTTHTERVHGRSEGTSEVDGGGGAPSSRVREAERKLQLVNDAQASDFTPSRVTCKACAANVALSETVPYQLESWLAHKTVCPASTSTANSPPAAHSANEMQGRSTQSPPTALNVSTGKGARRGMHPPPSTTSTDATCVASEKSTGHNLSSGYSIAGQKRPREDDDEETGGSVAVRPRTMSIIDQDVKPSGLWDWLKLPWETFKRGFTEGLEGTGR